MINKKEGFFTFNNSKNIKKNLCNLIKSSQGGNIWSKGQVGPVTNYGKLMKGNESENVLNKVNNFKILLF